MAHLVRINKLKGKWKTLWLALPALYLGLALLGQRAWVLRLAALFVFFGALAVAFAVMGLNPKYVVVKGGKLASDDRQQERATVEHVAKAFFVVCALLCFFYLFLPVLKGTIALGRGGSLETIEAEVTGNSTYIGTWFLAQGISVKGRDKSLQYFFSVERPVRIGQRYRFTVLPGTNFAVSVQPEGT